MTNIFPELDDHFDKGIPTDWGAFNKRLKDREFRNAAKGHPKSDWKLKRYLNAVGSHLDSPRKGRKVRGATGEYRVKYHKETDRHSCSCLDWRYKRSWRGKGSDCKHIKRLKRTTLMKKLAYVGEIGNLARTWSYANKRSQPKRKELPRRGYSKADRRQHFLDDWLLKVAEEKELRGQAAQRVLDRLRS